MTDRTTFVVPPGYKAERDEEGRATGRVIPEDIHSLIKAMNDALLQLGPGHRLISHGTRVELRTGETAYHEPGLDSVAEFHETFGAHINKAEPGVPTFGAVASYEISVYHAQAARLGEKLKDAAQKLAEHGDKDGSLMLIRLQLCQEELAELAEAILARDIVGCLDALTDMDYVCNGTYLTLGLGHYKLAALAEVHRSNMSKLGEDGKPITSSAGRIVKGPNYTPPDLKRVLFGEAYVNSREPGEFGDGVTVAVDSDLALFYDKLSRHDWSYMMSDDPSVYRRGEAAERDLRIEIGKGGPAYEKLFDEFKAYVWHGGAKPERPE